MVKNKYYLYNINRGICSTFWNGLVRFEIFLTYNIMYMNCNIYIAIFFSVYFLFFRLGEHSGLRNKSIKRNRLCLY